MKHTRFSFPLALMTSVALLFSCQKAFVEEDGQSGNSEGDLVTFKLRVAQLEEQPFEVTSYAGRSTDISSLCSRVSMAVYQKGEKVKQINQLTGDSDFGTLSIALPAGNYQMLVLAYGGSNTASMAHADKVTFGGKLSDIFCYADSLHLDGNTSENLVLRRMVAMFRLVTTDSIPVQVHSMQFAYTGGSSTLDGIKGEGCVQSRQKETLVVDEKMKGKPGSFTVYTFPRQGSNSLKMTVSALDANGKVLVEREFPSVAIHRNVITQYKGRFFTDKTIETPTDSTSHFKLITNDEWGENDVAF